ncbi:unnamed protein product [Ambrosiozyma monospora]|uniref:Unnamed protein product n=1 Tax=Ambrosiozyma monospora TaxID=43982 RepID=A0ACB5T0W9_AMBMO|nr:unnamed protein product [Ambrosiozyma monospora]
MNNNSENIIRSRDLCFVEEYYLQRSKQYLKPNFQVLATYSIDLTPELIFNALSKLLLANLQWSLQVHPKEPSKQEHKFMLIPEYNLNDVLEFTESAVTPLEELLVSLINKRYELSCNKPLWSLIVYDSRTLIFVADHLLGDGTSFANFHMEFLKFLNDKDSSNPLEYIGSESTIFLETLSTSDISPKPSEIIDYTPCWYFLIYVILKLIFPVTNTLYTRLGIANEFQDFSGEKLVVHKSNHSERLDFYLKVISLSNEQVGSLVKITRKHKVKLTSLLTHLCQLSLYPITENKDVWYSF